MLKKYRNIQLTVLVSFLFFGIGISQDIQFSQFYQAQLYQNPAFAGGMHVDRAMFHQRLQWPNIKQYGQAKYVTSFVSFDTYYKKYQSGYGVTAFYDKQGDGQITSMEISGQYAYELHLNSHYSLRSGLQLGWNSRTIDYASLTFPEQYDDEGFTGSANPYANFVARKNYYDIAAGAVLYTSEFWVGFSTHHLNTPEQTFIQGASELPMKLALTGGYKFVLHEDATGLANEKPSSEVSVIPTFHYKFQGKSDQLDLGIYGLYHQIIVGAWYRGIPFKKYDTDLNNHESIVFLAGYKFHNLSFTYSYDCTTSTLREVGTGGAHEINVTYLFGQKRWTKPTKRMPCPSFYIH